MDTSILSIVAIALSAGVIFYKLISGLGHYQDYEGSRSGRKIKDIKNLLESERKDKE